MPKPNRKKICIVVSSLGVGGAERSSGLLSEVLHNLGHEIYMVSVLNIIEFPYKGKLLNLGALKDEDNSVIGRLKRLRVFKKFIEEHNFDYVIDNRTRIGFVKEFIISKLIYKPEKTLYCVRSYNVKQYIHPNKILGKIIYGNASKIVTVSQEIARKIKQDYKLNNVTCIYNTVDIKNESTETDSLKPYILFFGRLDDDIKNVSLLLESYSKSKLRSHKIDLKILGSGKDLEKLKTLANNLKIAPNVQFLSHSSNPTAIVQSALFTVLTSRYEGFPRAITESLAVGTPVISVDCKSGPNEIVKNEFNGLLVENHNSDALAKAMNRFSEDKELYARCKANAKPSVLPLSKEEIGKQWNAILK